MIVAQKMYLHLYSLMVQTIVLALKSEYGAANEMEVTDTNAGKDYGYNATDGPKLTQTVAGINSAFVVDESMTRNSNKITDLYPGLTLELLATSGSPITLKSEVNLSKAKESLEAYVTTYNDLYKAP